MKGSEKSCETWDETIRHAQRIGFQTSPLGDSASNGRKAGLERDKLVGPGSEACLQFSCAVGHS